MSENANLVYLFIRINLQSAHADLSYQCFFKIFFTFKNLQLKALIFNYNFS